ncbi:uncharacterized protein LOC113330515 [Papaver somniferum]|uniref:uncharacterized protein LOC113330515 n=1 Tax=Papaver somniferum TaxID=3469 RepID=UPI000E6F672F|nr:uncharacterized protein LOC113330515 [Papaver somniferum]
MRHPVDSSAWRCADSFFPEFSKEARNVTLGIATDGFNPNGCFGLNYSCWPVILCPYNLPPSMCMKREFSMLCLLISGPRAPGKDIDVYLQPLIEELKELWNDGVMTFDSFTGSEFLMRARLLWAIHDFPALGTLSGCVTHGYFACPSCGEETDAEWLPYSKNSSLYRCDAYEKNITEHIVNTVLGNSKSKDGLNARKDMEAMGIKKRLWLKEDDNTGKTTMEDGSFALTKDEKVAFCTVLKNLRVPSNFCSNSQQRWLMKGFKGLVRNKRYIEGCIARGYSLREASLFFMDGMSDDGDDEMPLSTGKSMTLTQVQFEQCRSWILSKYFEIDDWRRKYDSYVSGNTSNGQQTSKSFHVWLRDDGVLVFVVVLIEAKETDSTLWRLVQGPLFKARSYSKYQVNGFTFSTLGCEAKNISQNSGVSMKAFTRLKAKSAEEAEITYYGVIKEIIVLNYMEFEETVFCCDWVSVGDKNACKVDAVSKVIKVNLSKMKNKVRVSDEPFILASEAAQVFYSKDLTDEGWSVVLHSHQGLTCSVDKFEVPTAYQSVLTDNENFKKLLSIGSI